MQQRMLLKVPSNDLNRLCQVLAFAGGLRLAQRHPFGPGQPVLPQRRLCAAQPDQVFLRALGRIVFLIDVIQRMSQCLQKFLIQIRIRRVRRHEQSQQFVRARLRLRANLLRRHVVRPCGTRHGHDLAAPVRLIRVIEKPKSVRQGIQLFNSCRLIVQQALQGSTKHSFGLFFLQHFLLR